MNAYRKPAALCAVVPGVERITRAEDVRLFIAAGKQEIEDRIARLGLRLRMAAWPDEAAIREFHARCWPPGHSTLEEPSLLFRILSWGFVPIVETADGRIVACNINESYDDAARTSYGVRITVDPAVAGHNLGAELARYSSLIGMERGSKVRRALVGLTNYSSVANILNHVGFVADAFHDGVPVPGPRFGIALPLSPAGLMNNRIDVEKTRAFVEAHTPGRDYVLVGCADTARIAELYARTPFRIAAYLKPGVVADEHTFVALPEHAFIAPPPPRVRAPRRGRRAVAMA
jgi:hypothetical protein